MTWQPYPDKPKDDEGVKIIVDGKTVDVREYIAQLQSENMEWQRRCKHVESVRLIDIKTIREIAENEIAANSAAAHSVIAELREQLAAARSVTNGVH